MKELIEFLEHNLKELETNKYNKQYIIVEKKEAEMILNILKIYQGTK